MSQILHDTIAKISIDHFNGLPKKGKPKNYEWIVLSCIVKEDTDRNHFEVVALGTGSKSIGSIQMSALGDILNDSHAEIISRRAFLKYIYEQISCNSDNIFHANLTLQNNIRFHFFTSHIPCGEAAVCSEEPEIKRAKLELPAEAKRLLKSSTIRAKPGRGDPTLSVSCSDKIMKWSYTGIQGALLMLILPEPIYLYSLTVVGQLPCDIDALSQALHGRFTSFERTSLFYQHKMILGQARINFDYYSTPDKQPCPTSIIWSKTKVSLEVAVDGKKQGVTKKNQYKKCARLSICKIELFRTFLALAEKMKLRPFANAIDVQYFVAKMKAEGYQQYWTILKEDVFKVWSVKNKELLYFTVD